MKKSERDAYSLIGRDDEILLSTKDPGEMEKVLREALKYLQRVTVTLPRVLSLAGSVERGARYGNPAKKEMVVLKSGGVERRFVREGEGPGGELGVSCESVGANVPIMTINIPFRSMDDPITDRGIVWVIPGNPAVASFVVLRGYLNSNESFSDIVAQAERAVREKVYQHFLPEPVLA